jgi:hypothetical protein
MAMANALSPGAAPAHILIGVENDGTITGIPATSHTDDAALHQKVNGWLNRTPTFEYVPVDVDGHSVGVYTIQPGRRPYFPLKDSAPSLQKHVARYRDGTSTEVASPQMILEWDREDDPMRHQQRLLEVRKLEFDIRRQEAQALVRAHFSHVPGINEGGHTDLNLILLNQGSCGITIEDLKCRVGWSTSFHQTLESANIVLPPTYSEPYWRTPLKYFVPAGKEWRHLFRWSREDKRRHFDFFNLQVVDVVGFRQEWATFHFELVCQSELGHASSLSHIVSAPY